MATEQPSNESEHSEHSYYVDFWYTTESSLEIEASSEEEAIEQAKESIERGFTGTASTPLLTDCDSFSARKRSNHE